jgi:hypothetical protein
MMGHNAPPLLLLLLLPGSPPNLNSCSVLLPRFCPPYLAWLVVHREEQWHEGDTKP